MRISPIESIKYLTFSLLFILISFYLTYNMELIGDNQNYYNIYNNINDDPFPFIFEFITSFLMLLSKKIGLDYFTFSFIKILLFIPAIIILDYKLLKKKPFLSTLFLISFLYPPFIDMMIFLTRQSLSINFLIFSIVAKKNTAKYIWYIVSIFTHISSIIFLPALLFTSIIYSFFKNKIIMLLILVNIFIGYFYKISLVDFVFYIFNTFGDYMPSFLQDNISRKIGFYSIYNSEDFDPLSTLRLIFIILTLIIFILTKNNKFHNNITQVKFLCTWWISILLFSFLLTNNMMATRTGFFSYYFCISIFIISISYLTKKNQKPMI